MTHARDVAGHVTELRDFLTDLELYEYGEVPGEKNPDGEINPGQKPNVYGLVQVERIGVAPLNAARHSRRTSWRASLRAVGRYSADNCRIGLRRLLELENTRLTVDGHTTTPLHVENAEDAHPDGTEFSALIRFTYSL